MQRSKRISSFLFPLVTITAVVWLMFNYQSVVDSVVVSRFEPNTQVNQLTKEIDFTDHGQFLFFAGQPELSEREEFNQHCEKRAEQTVVLGCYISPQRIYIYNVTDPRLAGVRQVTAAHEMLHVAYDRLGYVEKKQIDQMLEAAVPAVQQAEPELAERLKVYEKTEPGERTNELHSILGTEAVTLPDDLEQYYKRYFNNRAIITALAANYDKVFDDVKQQQDQLIDELETLAEQINQLTAQYNEDAKQLSEDIDAFNQKANREGSFASESEFDTERSALISRSDELEVLRKTVNTKAEQYEQKRQALNAINVQVKDLNQTIDSTSVPSI